MPDALLYYMTNPVVYLIILMMSIITSFICNDSADANFSHKVRTKLLREWEVYNRCISAKREAGVWKPADKRMLRAVYSVTGRHEVRFLCSAPSWRIIRQRKNRDTDNIYQQEEVRVRKMAGEIYESIKTPEKARSTLYVVGLFRLKTLSAKTINQDNRSPHAKRYPIPVLLHRK
jgi:hypothetical protein